MRVYGTAAAKLVLFAEPARRHVRQSLGDAGSFGVGGFAALLKSEIRKKKQLVIFVEFVEQKTREPPFQIHKSLLQKQIR